LLFTTKMLASTVKFSRCGRVRVSSESCEGAGQPAAEGGLLAQPNLQGPTACLSRHRLPRDFPLPCGLY